MLILYAVGLQIRPNEKSARTKNPPERKIRPNERSSLNVQRSSFNVQR
jgi:hypothetical protein